MKKKKPKTASTRATHFNQTQRREGKKRHVSWLVAWTPSHHSQQSENDIVDQGDGKSDQHAKYDPEKRMETYESQLRLYYTEAQLIDENPAKQQNEGGQLSGLAYPVQRTAACRLYSLANTKGTIPCGRAAYQHICAYKISAILIVTTCMCKPKAL